MSTDFTATRMGRGFAGGLPCQAPSEGDQPFASSPFAHPIPQSRRRASGDLFSGSLNVGLSSSLVFSVTVDPYRRDIGMLSPSWTSTM
jgi:hypothetical protein